MEPAPVVIGGEGAVVVALVLAVDGGVFAALFFDTFTLLIHRHEERFAFFEECVGEDVVHF